LTLSANSNANQDRLEMEFIIFWIFLSLLVGIFASFKKRIGPLWFLLSLIISPLITFIILLVSGPPGRILKKCPKCAEKVKKEAKICRFYGFEFSIWVVLILFIILFGCADIRWQKKLQRGYFDKNGNTPGYSNSWQCIKQAMKETGHNIMFEYCINDPKCKELAETCIKEKGYIEANIFETTEERMNLYRKAYEENWIKPGMTRLEVISILGAPQITTIQLIPSRKIWIYCRNATKTALIGFNFILQIIWFEDRVEKVERIFKI
jgi:hypothetical protein